MKRKAVNEQGLMKEQPKTEHKLRMIEKIFLLNLFNQCNPCKLLL